MKHYLQTIFLAMLLSMVGTKAFAADALINGIYYNFIGANAEVTYYGDDKYSHEVVIPNVVSYNNSNYTVTGIGDYAFNFCSDLTSVTIPNSVTTIGKQAFCSTGLTSITIPNSVTSIGELAFSDCSSLTSVNISDVAAWCVINFADDYSNPLYYAHHLFINGEEIKDLVIPNSVTSIGNSAFYGCSGLTSITIPNSVTSIGTGVFGGCSGLTSITIPNSVTTIGGFAFYGCTSLTSVTIPNSVTSIGDGAFVNCTGLTSITIPNSVTSIGNSAFAGCRGLTSITIPNSVTSIGERAFYYCSSLTSVTIPNGVTSIGADAFYGCSGLTSITIPNSVTSIGTEAFYGCSGLTSITIPNSVTSIGDWAFFGCSGLTTSIEIPNSVTSIGEYAFRGCVNVTSVTIPNSVTSIGAGAFSVCRGLTSITIPNSVTSIGTGVFGGCSGLTSITIPNSVTSIGISAFYGCNLTSVTIPNSVTSIGGNAFQNCTGLTSVTIPNSVTSIGAGAFDRCSSLTSVTIENETPINLTSQPFSNYANATLYVPAGCVTDYEAAAYWTDFADIKEKTVSITLNSLGKGTYCSKYPLDFTGVSGIAAYIICGFKPSAGNLSTLRVFEVPEETGLYIVGTPGSTYTIPVAPTDFYYSSMMKGVTVATVIPATEDGYTNYVLSGDGHGGVIFKRANNTSSPANRAYVQVPTGTVGAREYLGIETDDGSITGLDGVITSDTEEAEGDYYNLRGQKVQTPRRGIYIKNGKKIIIH